MTPISNNFLSSNLSSELIAGLTAAIEGMSVAGGGFTRYRHSKSGRSALDPATHTRLIPATAEPTNREILIKNETCPTLSLYWKGGKDAIAHTLPPGTAWLDVADGGMELWGYSADGGDLVAVVRSDNQISYNLGADAMPYFPIRVSLHFPTGANFPIPDATDTTTGDVPATYEQNIAQLFNSDQNVTGHKALAINSFTPGEDLSFTVVAAPGLYDPPIVLQLIHPLRVVRVAVDVMADLINPESDALPVGFTGRLLGGGWAGQVDAAEGGELICRPNYNRCMGRFIAKIPGENYFDTAIITDYTPNADPLQGGTFTLGGF